MKVLRSIQEVRGYRAGKGDLALVPTMGAFHDGHVELMRRARKDFDDVCVSLFVNPAQFGPNEDFAAYPRDEARDFEVAKQAGVGAIFAPSVEEMAMDTETRVVVKGVSELWEGEARPGHFEGVATVVLKLFNIVGPTAAYFGLKDLQQCSVIKKMCKDLDVDIDIRLVETVREPSGLAMSSRNAYFDQIQRAAAAKMFHTMQSAVTSAKDSGSSLREVE
ncbi:MAG TPA: pantoate--beta-alanine ligase, partial [Fimbriimonadaceae bacterium]|nr:pantoate--beta-alanine ligase [Fimbriimonadaceae bacterium]